MEKKDVDKKVQELFKLAEELSDAPVPVVKYRAEMVVGLFKELLVTAVDAE